MVCSLIVDRELLWILEQKNVDVHVFIANISSQFIKYITGEWVANAYPPYPLPPHCESGEPCKKQQINS